MTQETTNKQNTAKHPGNKKFSKAAFLESASSTKERLEYQVVLVDGNSYTKAEAEKLVKEWKQKGVEA